MRIFERFRRRRICTPSTKALLIQTVRHTKPIWNPTRRRFYGRVASDFIHDNFKPRSKVAARHMRDVRRGAGATRGAGARTCLQSSFLMSCEHYNAQLLLLRKPTDFTHKQRELRKTIKYSKSMKLRKHNGITHINNSLAGRLKQGTLPVQCLTAGAATLPSIHNVFCRHYANITQRKIWDFCVNCVNCVLLRNNTQMCKS